jgi:hypothetical protein
MWRSRQDRKRLCRREEGRMFAGQSYVVAAVCGVMCLSIADAAEVIRASSCAQADVQVAVNSAKDGDTVLMPAGNSVWTSPSTGNMVNDNRPSVSVQGRSLTLQGAGIDKTVITDNTGGQCFQVPIRVVNGGGRSLRIADFTFKSAATLADAAIDGIVNVSGGCKRFRIDHCKFEGMRFGNAIVVSGETYGVIDHCTFVTTAEPGNFKAFQIVGAGDDSWKEPLSLGTANAVYVEDCTLDYRLAYRCLDAANGARWVFRHNTVYNNTDVGTHGYDSDPRSQLSGEVYDNTFLHTAAGNYYTLIAFRGGTGVVFNNKVRNTVGGWNSFVSLYYYCACPGNKTNTHPTATKYPGKDQPGRGPDGDGDGVQDLEPIYEWNNTVELSPHIVVADICPEVHTFIKENRDYCQRTPRPGYVPYAYPHPLTLAGKKVEGPVVEAEDGK